jgi:thiol-disulfide isomerase/thioredoxin
MIFKKHSFLRAFFILFFGVACELSFSQVNRDDSIHYFEHLKEDVLMGNDIKGKTMPNFIVVDKNKNTFTNNDFRSKVTFINFWFSSCAPCLAEFQALEKLYNNNRSKEGFQFISITYEADSVIRRVQENNNLTYPIYHLSYDSCRKIKFNLGYPANLIVDKAGKIVYSIAGGSINPDDEDKFINHFIQAEIDSELKRSGNKSPQ